MECYSYQNAWIIMALTPIHLVANQMDGITCWEEFFYNKEISWDHCKINHSFVLGTVACCFGVACIPFALSSLTGDNILVFIYVQIFEGKAKYKMWKCLTWMASCQNTGHFPKCQSYLPPDIKVWLSESLKMADFKKNVRCQVYKVKIWPDLSTFFCPWTTKKFKSWL